MTDFVITVGSDSIRISFQFQEISLINSLLRILILWLLLLFCPLVLFLLGKLIKNPFKDVCHFLSQRVFNYLHV